MRPQSFPQYGEYGDRPRVYRFDLPFAAHGRVASCRVDIYGNEALAPRSPLTVVISDTPGSEGPSSVNNIEKVCALVWRDYLVPLGLAPQTVRWIQRFEPGAQPDEQWNEIQFKGKPGQFVEPRWTATNPVHLLWDRLLGDTCWVEEIRLVEARDIAEDELVFGPGECHQVMTGVCSLEHPVPSGLGGDRSSWSYCRQLARLGNLWRLILDYPWRQQPAAELDVDALLCDRALMDYVEQNWDSEFGPLPEILPIAIRVAVSSFGPKQTEPVALSGDIPFELTNGRHRACVARRLGIPLCATIGVQRNRRLAKATA